MLFHEFDHFRFVLPLMHGGRKHYGGIVVGVDRSGIFPEVLAFGIEPASA
jgi:hypothetical protein